MFATLGGRGVKNKIDRCRLQVCHLNEVDQIFKILHLSAIYHHCRPFLSGIDNILNFFEHIFKPIKGPLSGLFIIPEKCRSEG